MNFRGKTPRPWRSIFAAAALLTLIHAAGAAAAERPNIIFIFTDDHAPHAIGAYQEHLDFGEQLEGHTPTPNIDRLADEGMTFANAFVTNSICCPSRAVILTGKHSHLNGVPTNRQSFDGDQQTFIKELGKEGYQTALIGKWHLKSTPTGFDHFEVLYGQGPYYNPPMKTPDGRKEYTGYTTDIITDIALRWIDQGRNDDQPFMLMYQHKAPHRNWMPGPDHLDTYDDVQLPEPDSLFYDYSGLTTAATQQEMEIATHMRWGWDLKLRHNPENPDEFANGFKRYHDRFTDEQAEAWDNTYEPKNEKLIAGYQSGELRGRKLARWKYQRYMKDYLRSVKSVDDNIGRLMEYLEDEGIADNTVVIYCSDQGFFLGENGWFDKRWMYEESLRMPLIVRWPGVIEPGSVDKHLVQNLDLAQTFLDMAGTDAPDDMQGRSLLPLMKQNQHGEWRDSIYYHYYEYPGAHSVRRHYGVRTDRYKLIHFYTLDEWELFDLEKDPDELNSVYGDPEYAEVQERLKRELNRLQAKYGEDNPEAPLSQITRPHMMKKVRRVELERVVSLDSADSKPPQDLDPSIKPMTVGARCTPNATDGVLIARGGASLGYTLYLKDGRPHFAIRSGGVLKEVAADRKVDLGEPVHLAGVLDTDNTLHLYVDGEPVAEAEGHYIARNPGDNLSVGADTGSKVAEYESNLRFDGKLSDIRVYWGVLGDDAIRKWAQQ